MIFGNSARLLLLLCLCASPAAAEEPLTLAELMSARQAVKSSRATFTELRTLAILDRPLESSGTLRFVAPSHLEKHTLAPHEEHLVLDGEEITVDQGPKAKPRRFKLSDSPEMSALIESIRGTLAGDEVALARYYVVQIQGTAKAWEILLLPKLAKVQALVDSIRIAGGGKTIQTVETVEHGGDGRVMRLTETGP
jgi:hypothetical protein